MRGLSTGLRVLQTRVPSPPLRPPSSVTLGNSPWPSFLLCKTGWEGHLEGAVSRPYPGFKGCIRQVLSQWWERRKGRQPVTIVQALLGDPDHDARVGSRHSRAHGGQHHQGCPPPRGVRASGHVFVLQSCQNLEVLEGNQGPIKEAAVEMQVRRMEKGGRNTSRGGRGGGRLPACGSPPCGGATAPEQAAVGPGSPVCVCVCVCMCCVCVYVWHVCMYVCCVCGCVWCVCVWCGMLYVCVMSVCMCGVFVCGVCVYVCLGCVWYGICVRIVVCVCMHVWCVYDVWCMCMYVWSMCMYVWCAVCMYVCCVWDCVWCVCICGVVCCIYVCVMCLYVVCVYMFRVCVVWCMCMYVWCVVLCGVCVCMYMWCVCVCVVCVVCVSQDLALSVIPLPFPPPWTLHPNPSIQGLPGSWVVGISELIIFFVFFFYALLRYNWQNCTQLLLEQHRFELWRCICIWISFNKYVLPSCTTCGWLNP